MIWTGTNRRFGGAGVRVAGRLAVAALIAIGLGAGGLQRASAFPVDGSKSKLTPPEARELAQSLRQLQAAVNADHQAKTVTIPVSIKRPARTVTPPTMTPAELDRLVAQYLRKNDPKVDPAPITTDIEFVRRVYFDMIGKPPTPDQVAAFVRDRSRDKRARLIDHLLKSPAWARSWARYWRDVIKFRATNENLRRVRFDELEDWLAAEVQANRPWDQIVTRMISATGPNDQNGAVAFPLAYEVQPVEMAGEVSRIFLGVQIQCAQCHDHKTDSWKRQQFHEFASFFAGARQRQLQKPMPGQLPVIAVQYLPRARYVMPDKQNPTRQIPIAPRFFLTAEGSSKSAPALPMNLGPQQRRELVASYITGQDNRWFARAFVNRTWYVLMGEAFYEPIDDIGPERTARAPEVLEPLADQWQRGGYDIRWLYHTIMNTQAYQRRVRSTATAAGKTQFASGCPSRLRGDQVFEALAEALGLPLDADGNVAQPARKNANIRPAMVKKQTAAGPVDRKKFVSLGQKSTGGPAAGKPAKNGAGKKLRPALRRNGVRAVFERIFGVDPSVPNDEVLGTIPQALFMMNDRFINNHMVARPGTVLGDILAASPNERAALNAIYMRVLSRPPTSKEVEICGRYLAMVRNPREAFEDIYWSLINSTEFLTRR